MPKCKLGHCREEAVPFGKRYCPKHLAEYKAKRAEYERIQATLRCCDACGEKLTKMAHDRGDRLCQGCQERAAVAEAAARRRAEHRRFETQRLDDLEACQSVDDLKAFILRYMSSVGQ